MTPAAVLIVVTRRLGDVLLTTPVVRSVRAHWPATAIDLLVFSGTEGVVRAHPEVRQVLSIPERPSWRQHLALLRRIFQKYDLALSVLPGDRPVLYARLAAGVSISAVLPGHKHAWKRALLSVAVPFDEDVHTVLMNTRIASAAGLAGQPSVEPSWTGDDERSVRSLWPAMDGQFAVLHPSPQFTYKEWYRSGWTDVARWLGERGITTVLTGGPTHREQTEARSLLPQLPEGAIDMTGKLSLSGTAFLLSRACAYVGPDTVVTHMAAALGIPTVALFGPSNPIKWGPWPRGQAAENPYRLQGSQRVRHVVLLQGPGDCVPCLKEGCERHVESRSDCLDRLPSASVISALSQLLGEPAS